MNRATFLRRASALLIAPSLLSRMPAAAPPAELERAVTIRADTTAFRTAMLRYIRDDGHPLTPWMKVPLEQVESAERRGLIMRGPTIALKQGDSIHYRIPTVIS